MSGTNLTTSWDTRTGGTAGSLIPNLLTKPGNEIGYG